MTRRSLQRAELCFPADIRYLSWVHALFERVAGEYDFDARRRNLMLVTISEAFTNAVIHGSRKVPNAVIDLVIITRSDYLEIKLIDHGRGLIALPPHSEWGALDPEREGGRGLDLMDRLTDDMQMTETFGGGLTVRLRYRAPAPEPRPPEALHIDISAKGEAMELQAEQAGELDVLRVTGRLDLVGANALKDEIRRRLQDNRRLLVLNLENVDFINSSGLGALVSVLKDVRLVKGRLALTSLASYVKEIFTITQLSNVFEIFETERQAREALNTPVATA